MALHSLGVWVCLASLLNAVVVSGDCWLIEGEKGFVWLAICSQNQPPYESIPQHINSTIVDLRLNENKIRSVQYSSLNRFGNLTELNLTKNQISYIEDGAFSAQDNLRVLQLGFNKLRNITEGILRGLARLEYLYLQANLIEAVSPNSFWECPNVLNIDLSMNRLQSLEGATFLGLSKLSTCELSGNPFHCSCALLGFLKWLVQFHNATRNSERTQCTGPAEFAGFPLLGQGQAGARDALTSLALQCNEELSTGAHFTQGPSTTAVSESPCEADDCPSGEESTPLLSFQSPVVTVTGPPAELQLKEVSHTSATLLVRSPSPAALLVQYKNSVSKDVKELRAEEEEVRVDELSPNTNYTYCVASVRNSRRYNQTCIRFATRARVRVKPLPVASNTTHYIMTILGCLLGAAILLSVTYYCLRKKKEEREKDKGPGDAKKTIIELKYAPELETITITQMAQKNMPPSDLMPSRLPFLPSPGPLDDYDVQEALESPTTSRGSYMDVRTAEHPYHRDILESMFAESHDSAAEISTIAKEVDQVNLIINNCIDALQTESSSFRGPSSGAFAEPPPGFLVAEESLAKPGFLSPVYRESYHHPLKRHSSVDAAPRCPSNASNCSVRSPRSVRSERDACPRSKAEGKSMERTSPARSAILSGTPCRMGRADAGQLAAYGDHPHLYAGLHSGERKATRSPSPCFVEAPPRSRSRRNLAYTQFSPQYHSVSYASSPEYSSKPSKGVWERYKPHEKWRREEEEYLAAGYALRKKVQFATDEDLHDILDYWKGVSSQQKS
ncbi:protein ELFN1-like [Narcine bancroftii]|uniref:protein ELFN1-like n=1 Tax=Narcine bancroftii TaxID=1343680 RepID=UPI0038310C79